MTAHRAPALILLFAACRALAGAPVPADAMAWWRFDPTRFASTAPTPEVRAQREAMLAMVRSAVTGGAVGEGTALGAVRGLLAASEIGGRPHTLSVLDFAAHRPPSGEGADVDRLEMALEIEADGGHERFLPTIRTILLPAKGENGMPPGRQRAFELPGGSRAVAYTEPGWEPWREVSWASTPGAFLVGLGEGSLAHWIAPAADAREAPWIEHRAAIDAERAPGEVFFEAYLGIARLRDAFPAAFASGRAHRILSRLNLLDADDLLLQARFVEIGEGRPAMIAIDAAYKLPGDDNIHHLPLSADHWPDDLTIPPPPGSYVIAAPIDWPAFVGLGLDLWIAANVDAHIPEYAGALTAWRTEHQDDLDAFLGALLPWAIVSDYPTPMLPIPGAATVIVPLNPDGGAEASRRFSRLLGPFADAIHTDRAGVSSYAVDPVGLIRMPGWAVFSRGAHPAFIAAWSPTAVQGAQTWLEDLATPDRSPRSSPSPTP